MLGAGVDPRRHRKAETNPGEVTRSRTCTAIAHALPLQEGIRSQINLTACFWSVPHEQKPSKPVVSSLRGNCATGVIPGCSLMMPFALFDPFMCLFGSLSP